MRYVRWAILVGTFSLLVGGGAGDAGAYDFGWGYYPHGYPWVFGSPTYRTTTVPTPPYFAIHPPVYYGLRVGMPYGNSPITRPPRPVVRERVVPSVAEPSEGQWIDNPYVRSAAADSEARRPGRAAPGMVQNPFAARGTRSAPATE